MERADRILRHPVFLENLEKISAAEADRRFCRHNMEHFLDVARIGRIINAEEGFGIETEEIYAAGLLHDIGRAAQGGEGASHEFASALLAERILRDCGFSEEETAAVADAIRAHRTEGVSGEKNLRGLLYRADKASRPCYACRARGECRWEEEKKNLHLLY